MSKLSLYKILPGLAWAVLEREERERGEGDLKVYKVVNKFPLIKLLYLSLAVWRSACLPGCHSKYLGCKLAQLTSFSTSTK